MTRREGRLFDLSKVVIGVAGENETSNGDERVVFVRDDLGDIKNVPLVAETINFGHNLNLEVPFDGLASVQSLNEVTASIVRVGNKSSCLFTGEVLDSLSSFEVKLNPEGLSVLVDPSECMGGIAVHVSESVGSSSVAHEDSHLVSRLRAQAPEVPMGSGVLHVGAGALLLAVNKIGEFHGISDEEDGSVVSGHVPVALLRVELNSET